MLKNQIPKETKTKTVSRIKALTETEEGDKYKRTSPPLRKYPLKNNP